MYERRDRSNDMTARELFTMNHKKLLEDAEISIKGTATSCTVVGALIVTMVFAAAFTVPGGNDGNTGFPMFLNHKLFKIKASFRGRRRLIKLLAGFRGYEGRPELLGSAGGCRWCGNGAAYRLISGVGGQKLGYP
ncbi:hypothetical protein ACLB2K_046664 [Fragaria x ananassa]